MLYSEKELEKRLKAGCALYYFYASDEALVHTAAQKTLKYLNRDDPETTVLDGPTPLGGGDRASCRYDFILRRQTPGTHAADPSVNLFRQGFAGALRHAGRHRERHLCADEHHRGELRQTAPRQAGAKAHCQLREARLLCTAQPPHGRGFTGYGPRLGEGDRCGLCPRRRSCAAGPLRRGSVPA